MIIQQKIAVKANDVVFICIKISFCLGHLSPWQQNQQCRSQRLLPCSAWRQEEPVYRNQPICQPCEILANPATHLSLCEWKERHSDWKFQKVKFKRPSKYQVPSKIGQRFRNWQKLLEKSVNKLIVINTIYLQMLPKGTLNYSLNQGEKKYLQNCGLNVVSIHFSCNTKTVQIELLTVWRSVYFNKM